MSERKIKQVLDYLLGLRTGGPDDEIKPLLREYEKMRGTRKLPAEMKQKGWEQIRARKEKMAGEKKEPGQRVIRPAPAFWKKTGFGFSAGVAALLVAAVSIFLWNRPTGTSFDKALVYVQSGDVRIGGKPVQDGAEVKTGEWIVNDRGSYRLVLPDAMALDVQYQSRLRIVVRPDKIVVELEDGGVAAVVHKKEPGRDLVFQTPTGAVSVKGTVFYLRVMSSEKSYFCICHGTVELITEHERKVVQAAHHGGYSMVREGGREKITSDTMLYHQDPLLEEMAESLHHPLDWAIEP